MPTEQLRPHVCKVSPGKKKKKKAIFQFQQPMANSALLQFKNNFHCESVKSTKSRSLSGDESLEKGQTAFRSKPLRVWKRSSLPGPTPLQPRKQRPQPARAALPGRALTRCDTGLDIRMRICSVSCYSLHCLDSSRRSISQPEGSEC